VISDKPASRTFAIWRLGGGQIRINFTDLQ
jgi:hypothetical protein